MKTILVLTDFSISADYVADYALALAQKIEANLLVCNIYQVPDGEDIAAHNCRPLSTETNSINDLGAVVARLKTKLNKQQDQEAYRPEIEQYSEGGLVGQKLTAIKQRHDILLAIVSVHSRNNFTNFFEKDHTWDIIKNIDFPVLVIPYQVRFKPFKLIAFATVMNNTDIGVLELLSGIAKYSNSEILVTHVSAKLREEDNIKQFFNQIPFKITYPKILYHNIKGTDVVISLKQLCAHIDIDLLVIVHRSAGFFKELFGTSLTHKMATQPTKPLLVFPCQAIQETLLLPIDQHF